MLTTGGGVDSSEGGGRGHRVASTVKEGGMLAVPMAW